MGNRINLHSYASGSEKDLLKEEFTRWHSHFPEIKIRIVESELPGNEVKILAVRDLVEESENDEIYILCDIDTKIIRFPKGEILSSEKDVSIFCRKLIPSHLNNLSGFIIFRYTSRTRSFLRKWLVTYEKLEEKNWYSDQISLGRSLLESESINGLQVNDLSKLSSKLKFYWSTDSNIFLNAYTHKGKNTYFLDKWSFRYRYLSLLLDTLLVPWNYLLRIIRSAL